MKVNAVFEALTKAFPHAAIASHTDADGRHVWILSDGDPPCYEFARLAYSDGGYHAAVTSGLLVRDYPLNKAIQFLVDEIEG